MGSKGNPATLVDPIYLSICNRDKAFCDLIKLIPKDVYYHTTTADGLAAGVEDEDEISNRYYKHKKAPLAADEKKRQRKQRRDATYGLGEEADETADAADAADDAILTAPTSSSFDYELDNVEGIQTLKKRLHDKIASMQSSRNQPKEKKEWPAKEADADEATENVSDDESGVEVEDDESDGSEDVADEGESDSDMSIDIDDEDASEASEDSGSDAGVDDIGDIDFSGIISSRKDPTEPVVRNAPGSKMKRLKKLVEESKKKRQRLDEMKAQGGSGKERAEAEAWNDVIKEASGEKVLSNTKRLQKAIRAREKKKEKSTATWQGRVENLAADKTERINKREANIKQRQLGIAPAPTPTEDKAGAAAAGTKEKTAPSRKERSAFAKKIGLTKKDKDGGDKKGGDKKGGHKGGKGDKNPAPLKKKRNSAF